MPCHRSPQPSLDRSSGWENRWPPAHADIGDREGAVAGTPPLRLSVDSFNSGPEEPRPELSGEDGPSRSGVELEKTRDPAGKPVRPRGKKGKNKEKTPIIVAAPDFGESPNAGILSDIHSLLAEIPRILDTSVSKSVTKDMREDVTGRACRAIALLNQLAGGQGQPPNGDSAAAPAGGCCAAAPELLERVVARAVRMELGRSLQRAEPQKVLSPGYARVAAGSPDPQLASSRHRGGPAPLASPSRPALVLTCEKERASREDAVGVLRSVVNYRETGYTPAKIQKMSNSRFRVEFDAVAHVNDAIGRINSSSAGASAEAEKKIRPMVILKGISKDIAREEIVALMREQNEELHEFDESDMTLRFLRNNRSPNLYNAVLSVAPRAWRGILALERVRLEYQRVHVQDFSPFVQCRRCHQFGHTQTHCSAERLCAHCGRTDHEEYECPLSGAPPICSNCVTFNAKFKLNVDTKHSALSQECPKYRSMLRKIQAKIDYGTQ